MKIKIQKRGKTSGIRIPAKLLNELNSKENDILNIIIKEDKIILEKSNRKDIYELFENYKGDYSCEEFDPYDVVGNELW